MSLDAVAVKAGFGQADELYAAVRARRAQHTADRHRDPGRAAARDAAPEPESAPEVVARQSKAAGAGSGILVVGVDRLMTNLARCCKPAPPDRIVGFVTRGKGVTIHRQTCSNVVRMRAREPERLIEANWGEARDEVFPVDVVLEAMDRQGLLRDITEIFSRERINVTAANTLTTQQRDADGVHARSEEPRRAQPRARARQGRQRCPERRTALKKNEERRAISVPLRLRPARKGAAPARTRARLQPADCTALVVPLSALRRHGGTLARSLQAIRGHPHEETRADASRNAC